MNDTHGHETGNRVIQEFGQALSARGAWAYHLHGDEFALLLAGHDAALVESAVREAVIALGEVATNLQVSLAASFGAAFGGLNDSTADKLRGEADRELYRAKEATHSSAGPRRSHLAVSHLQVLDVAL